jgi:hypothetical protein
MRMRAPEVQGIDLFKIAGRSISGWIPSLKTGTVIRQPFCSQLEERLLLWLEYHPLVKSYARGDIDPQFATRVPAADPSVPDRVRQFANSPRVRFIFLHTGGRW